VSALFEHLLFTSVSSASARRLRDIILRSCRTKQLEARTLSKKETKCLKNILVNSRVTERKEKKRKQEMEGKNGPSPWVLVPGGRMYAESNATTS